MEITNEAAQTSQTTARQQPHMLISNTLLRQIVGAIWLIDGLLQLQPQMFTMNMVNGVMAPTANGQPALIAATLHWIIAVTTHNLTLINWIIALVQIAIGVCLLLGRWVKPVIIVSIVWALIVWYAGEGMSMLLTGQGSILTGAPGAVLLYPLLALVFYPTSREDGRGLLSRLQLRYVLAGFWVFAGLLQLQPYWWQSGQISQQIGGMYSPGTLSGILLDPSLHGLSAITAGIEIPLNIVLIVVCFGLGISLLLVKTERVRTVLIVSIVLSLIVWWSNEALGMILTGMATDFNSGLLIIMMALACWPLAKQRMTVRQKIRQTIAQTASSAAQS